MQHIDHRPRRQDAGPVHIGEIIPQMLARIEARAARAAAKLARPIVTTDTTSTAQEASR